MTVAQTIATTKWPLLKF